MTEAEKMFHDDIREKKSIKNSANKTNRTGKGPIRFPSDYLSKKEKNAMNGECITWNLNGFYSLDEFKSMPDDIKISWINRILNVYNARLCDISAVVFNKCDKYLSQYLQRSPEIRKYINVPRKGAKISETDYARFMKAVEEWRNPKAIETLETLGNELVKEEPVEVPKDFSPEERDFITRYIAPLSEPKKEEPVNMINPSEELVEIHSIETSPVELPRMSHIEFSMDGFDMGFLQMIKARFGDQQIRVCVSVYVEKSIDE